LLASTVIRNHASTRVKNFFHRQSQIRLFFVSSAASVCSQRRRRGKKTQWLCGGQRMGTNRPKASNFFLSFFLSPFSHSFFPSFSLSFFSAIAENTGLAPEQTDFGERKAKIEARNARDHKLNK
jgi:hypothetical protein